jgi:uncharacterized membrane protein
MMQPMLASARAEWFLEFVEWASMAIELLGTAVILFGGIAVLIWCVVDVLRKQIDRLEAYSRLRKRLGRAILLGLEFLVAADIIATVMIDQTLESVLSLGIVVLIRTFLSWSLEVELDGRWPWQGKAHGKEVSVG